MAVLRELLDPALHVYKKSCIVVAGAPICPLELSASCCKLLHGDKHWRFVLDWYAGTILVKLGGEFCGSEVDTTYAHKPAHPRSRKQDDLHSYPEGEHSAGGCRFDA